MTGGERSLGKRLSDQWRKEMAPKNKLRLYIIKHLKQLDGVDNVEANEKTGYVAVEGKNVSIDDIQKQVKDLGYKLEGIIK